MANELPLRIGSLWGLPLIDVAVIVLYFAGVIWIGLRAMRRITNQEDYFLAGRNFGKFIQTFAAFGQGTSAESAVNVTTKVSRDGVAGLGAAGLASGLIMLPPMWMVTIWYRRLRLLSLADFFEERYRSKAMAGFYAFCQALFFIIVAAMGFVAMSKTVAAIAVKPDAVLTSAQLEERGRASELDQLQARDYRYLDDGQKTRLEQLSREKPRREFSYVNEKILIIVIALIVLVYAVAGGLEAAFVTDTIQGIFIIVLTLILIPFAMMRINQEYGETGLMGTFRALHAHLPESYFDLLGSPQLAEVTWYWLASFAVLGTVNVMVQANQLTAAGSAKDDETARIGFVTGIFIKRYCMVIWAFVAMMTTLLYGSTVSDPDYIWGVATRDLLGPLGIGLVGLMIACLTAALMSTADALMLTTSALLTRSIYRPLAPGRSESHYVLMGRLFCLAYLVGGVVVSLYLRDVFKLFKYMVMFNAIMAAAFLLGMVWRRATRAGAWTSMGATFAFTLALPVLLPWLPGMRGSDYLAKTTDPVVIERTYRATEADVLQRREAVEQWNQLEESARTVVPRPTAVDVGEQYTRSVHLPGKPIFWSEGIDRGQDGQVRGKGMLNVELVALDLMGWDLSKHRYSLIETVSFLARLVVPFGALLVVSWWTQPEEKAMLDQFYGKMRTPVDPDPESDARAMAMTRESPTRLDHLKLFGEHSNWEFRRWNRRDWVGQGWVCLGIAGIVLLLLGLVKIGA